MLRWSQVFKVWCICGLMYASYHVTGSINTLLKAVSSGLAAFLIVDLIGSYVVYKMEKTNLEDLPDETKMNIISIKLEKTLKRAVKLRNKYGENDERTVFAFAEASALTEQYKKMVNAYGKKIHQEIQKLDIE